MWHHVMGLSTSQIIQISHWKEMIEDPKQRIGRPRQLYLGKGQRKYKDVNQRIDWHSSLTSPHDAHGHHGKGHLHLHEEFIDKSEPPSSPQISPRASATKLDLTSIAETEELTAKAINDSITELALNASTEEQEKSKRKGDKKVLTTPSRQ